MLNGMHGGNATDDAGAPTTAVRKQEETGAHKRARDDADEDVCVDDAALDRRQDGWHSALVNQLHALAALHDKCMDLVPADVAASVAVREANARFRQQYLDVDTFVTKKFPKRPRPDTDNQPPEPRTEHDDFDYVFDWGMDGGATYARDIRPEALARFADPASPHGVPRHGQRVRFRGPKWADEVLAVAGVGRCPGANRPPTLFFSTGCYVLEGRFDIWTVFEPTDLPDAELR